ncbi:MAG: Sec-independent protein translocase protein TatB [Beijerinckiaceae bacterium]
MFDIGGGELLVIGIVALVVIGPKELPGLLRTAGNAMGKVRRMASEFRGQFDEAMREAELDQAKKAFTDVNDVAQSATTNFNPLETIRNEIKSVKDEIKGTPAATLPDPVVPLPAEAPPVSIVSEPAAAPVAEAAPKPKRSRKKADDSSGSAA